MGLKIGVLGKLSLFNIKMGCVKIRFSCKFSL